MSFYDLRAPDVVKIFGFAVKVCIDVVKRKKTFDCGL